DDAVSFELEKCKAGLDLNAENDKYTYLKKAVSVLASLEDALQRDVYISRISRDAGININFLNEQVAHDVKAKKNI
ncbi:MAG: DNA primase, partial [Oscillospiraceae bacterium]|nr:DNA primase [Oscillospiraceae bacterium]